MVLKKESVLFDRDEKGKLLPKEVELLIDENDDDQLKFKEEKILITPMTRGEIKRLFSTVVTKEEEKDLDGDLIVEHCKEPAYTKEETEFMKGSYASMIVNTIMRYSGINVGNKKKAMVEKEDEFAKN